MKDILSYEEAKKGCCNFKSYEKDVYAYITEDGYWLLIEHGVDLLKGKKAVWCCWFETHYYYKTKDGHFYAVEFKTTQNKEKQKKKDKEKLKLELEHGADCMTAGEITAEELRGASVVRKKDTTPVQNDVDVASILQALLQSIEEIKKMLSVISKAYEEKKES
jgi:hypothetical protein